MENRADEYRVIADDLRNLAKRPGGFARRVKLIILAEQFEELAHELDIEFAGLPNLVSAQDRSSGLH